MKLTIIIILIVLIILNFKYYENFTVENKLCCLFAYYEKNNQYKENLQCFLDNAILDDVDYYIILNGPCSINIKTKENIKIIKRENKGYDFGAHSYAVNNFIKKKYDYYIFLNSSVKGPYLRNNIKWYQPFIKLFNNKDIKIVGTTINIFDNDNFNNKIKNTLADIYKHPKPYPHVQSMFYIIDKEYFNYLKLINFYDEVRLNSINNIDEIILYYEFGLSQHALNKGWNINCIIEPYRDLDYRIIDTDFNPYSNHGDIYYKNAYFGKNIDPYDVIFFKNNRDF